MGKWKELLGDVGHSAGRLVKALYEEASGGAGQVAEYADDLYERWLSEDEARILDDCPVATGILAHRDVFDADPEIFSQLYNVRVRPVLTAAVLGASGGGMLAFDEALSKVTRKVFDGDQLIGGWGADRIASWIGPEKFTEINRFMDTVPGASVPGGGWLHRIQHGHDLSAVAQIFQEHGSDGGIQALYHIYGRDFFTPAGVPILPAGSNEVHKFLTDQLDMKPLEAADLLSMNFVEVLGGVMAGVFTVMALYRLVNLAKAIHENNTVRDLVQRATSAGEAGDFLTASTLLHDALSYRPRDGMLTFILASMHHRSEKRLQAHLAFRDVTVWTASDEPMLELGGAKISLRGIAATGALATSDALARSDQHKSAWLRHVIELSRAGVTAYESVAYKLLDRRFIKRFGESSVLPPCFLSAAMNFYLAGRLAGASMYLPDREAVLARTVRKMDEALQDAGGRSSLKDRVDDLQFMRRLAKAELSELPAATAA